MYWIRGKCNYCEKETEDQSSVCDSCYEDKVKPETKAFNDKTIPNVKQTVWLENYGNVSAARLDELNRRALITDKNGKEHLCRLGENGKIQERHPDYY